MRAMCRVLLMSAVCLVASFNAVSAVTTTDFDQTDPSNAFSDGALLTQSRTAAVKYNNSPRFLRAFVTAELSTDSEERGISSVIAKLEAKLKATLKKMGITPALLTKIKRRIRYYFWNQMWNIRYTIWLKKKVTPEQMYEKLSVRYTSGPYHKNYRIYVKYLRIAWSQQQKCHLNPAVAYSAAPWQSCPYAK
ncbi:hypothetical protein BBI17_008956 [Phytophthora kernoviae]|uniref:RxLR effector protein n=2 Tax=Phytophthora kernoviae TaxID=325452 RepID=A0A421FEJ7_9STRA|nr:hypothetical protein BBI17_008956 [Phytophthora kernoviae]